MDVDFWSSRVKHLSSAAVQQHASRHSLHHHSGNHLAMDDSEGDDEVRPCFPCPFCYVDIEAHLLCNHLQEEHCFDLRNAVCPICAVNLGKDATGHFMVQHASSIKHRRTQKYGFWSADSAMLGKELSSFLRSSPNARMNAQESTPDPLLSPFVSAVVPQEPKGSHQKDSSNKNFSITSHSKSVEILPSDEDNGLDVEERRQRAAFVQELIGSTIFDS